MNEKTEREATSAADSSFLFALVAPSVRRAGAVGMMPQEQLVSASCSAGLDAGRKTKQYVRRSTAMSNCTVVSTLE